MSYVLSKFSSIWTGLFWKHENAIFTMRLLFCCSFSVSNSSRRADDAIDNKNRYSVGIIFESFASPWRVVVVWLFSIGPCFVSPLCLIYYLVIATFFFINLYTLDFNLWEFFLLFLFLKQCQMVRRVETGVCWLFSAHFPLNLSAHSTSLSWNALHRLYF